MNHTQLLHRTTAFFLAVLSLTAALTGCSGKTSDVGQLNVALQTTAQGVPAYIAEVEGIDAQAGLTVSSTVFASGPAQNEALGANEWDVATMGAPPAIMANLAYDARILALVLMEASTEFFVRPGSEIAQVSGAVPGYPQILGDADTWRGKTVLCPVATTSHFILLTLLEMLGLTEADIIAEGGHGGDDPRGQPDEGGIPRPRPGPLRLPQRLPHRHQGRGHHGLRL